MSERQFTGFSGETILFLMDLGMNNNRSWMDKNRDRYRVCLLEPFKALVSELAPFMERLDPFMEVRPQVGKTISRISRDARRNKGKPPYRTNMWFTFRVPGPDWKDSPGYFFELFPDRYRYGMGFYFPSRETMSKIHEEIAKNPSRFTEKTRILRESDFSVFGEKYKRKRKREGVSEELLEWFQYRDFYIAANREIDDILMTSALVDHLKIKFSSLSELYEYFWELKMKASED
ncbi:DUF2461 domain-containing protein [Mesotoga sp.]|uniref:DUF2461 domain-containing protein n=1 Tax=Mesotoga sp. TaxID=2053577 RepID=UPI00345F15C8